MEPANQRSYPRPHGARRVGRHLPAAVPHDPRSTLHTPGLSLSCGPAAVTRASAAAVAADSAAHTPVGPSEDLTADAPSVSSSRLHRRRPDTPSRFRGRPTSEVPWQLSRRRRPRLPWASKYLQVVAQRLRLRRRPHSRHAIATPSAPLPPSAVPDTSAAAPARRGRGRR